MNAVLVKAKFLANITKDQWFNLLLNI